jgi:hypothetical protein
VLNTNKIAHSYAAVLSTSIQSSFFGALAFLGDGLITGNPFPSPFVGFGVCGKLANAGVPGFDDAYGNGSPVLCMDPDPILGVCRGPSPGGECTTAGEPENVLEGNPNPTLLLLGFGVPGAEGGNILFSVVELKYGD